MPNPHIYRLRQLAAILVTASGLWQVAGLWSGRLDEPALLTAAVGSAYLLIGLGLFGQSRFTLFVAIAVTATQLWLAWSGDMPWTLPRQALTVIDAAVMLISARVLWALRHQPSV